MIVIMYIEHDINSLSRNNSSAVQLLLEPRQCGKSTLLSNIIANDYQEVTFDNLHMRILAQRELGLFLGLHAQSTPF